MPSFTLRRGASMEDVIGKQAFVYFNLHSGQWSVRVGGLVLAHARYVLLEDGRGKVSQAGRERVLREGKKNVHAGITGTVVAIGADAVSAGMSAFGKPQAVEEITYNPYKYDAFVNANAPGFKFQGAPLVYMGRNRYVSAWY